MSHNSQIAKLSLQSSKNTGTMRAQQCSSELHCGDIWVLQYTKPSGKGEGAGSSGASPSFILPNLFHLIALFLTCNLNVHLLEISVIPSYSWWGMLCSPQGTKPAANPEKLLEGWLLLNLSDSTKEYYAFIFPETSKEWGRDAQRAVKKESFLRRFSCCLVFYQIYFLWESAMEYITVIFYLYGSAYWT